MQRVKEKGYAMVGDVYESKISSYEGYLCEDIHSVGAEPFRHVCQA